MLDRVPTKTKLKHLFLTCSLVTQA